jgi:hypothetical protein
MIVDASTKRPNLGTDAGARFQRSEKVTVFERLSFLVPLRDPDDRVFPAGSGALRDAQAEQ